VFERRVINPDSKKRKKKEKSIGVSKEYPRTDPSFKMGEKSLDTSDQNGCLRLVREISVVVLIYRIEWCHRVVDGDAE
jgi:hypothetical protein